MKKLFASLALLGTCVTLLCLQDVEPLYAAETLKVIKDHFEFREEPRVADETLLGTLRIDTPVVWTGNTSGSWFEVQAPNGQRGWMHSSGLSRPKTPPKPAAPKTRSLSKPAATKSPSNAALTKLQKINTQNQALLDEKDRRITELSKDLEALEEKLSDTAQLIDDTEQLRKLDQLKVTEIKSELAALKESLKEKDEALLTQKVESTKLQNRLTNIQAQQQTHTWERLALYALFIPLTLLALVLLALLWRRTRRQPLQESPSEREGEEELRIPHRESAGYSKESSLPASEPTPPTREKISGVEELDIVMTAPLKEDTPQTPQAPVSHLQQDTTIEDSVEIDLADVLPSPSHHIQDPHDMEDMEIISEAPEIIEEELPELASQPPEPQPTPPEPSEQRVSSPPEDADYQEEEEEAVELLLEDIEVLEEPELLEEEPLITEQATSQATVEPLISAEHEEQIELDKIRQQLDALETEQEEPEPDLSELDKQFIEELLETPPESTNDSSLDELLEEGDLEELEEETHKHVDIAGETFEMLVERNTQIIEEEEETIPSERELIQEGSLSKEKRQERGERAQREGRPRPTAYGHPRGMSPQGPIQRGHLEQRLTSFESSDEQEQQDFEPENTIEATRPRPHAVVIADAREEAANDKTPESSDQPASSQELIPELEEEKTPAFFEPSLRVIEPENEPEDLIEEDEKEFLEPSGPKEWKYDIELLTVGPKKDHIMHILSKIEGLAKPPQELIETVPCLIARGAKEQDAKNFQLVMEKFGSAVRLIKK